MASGDILQGSTARQCHRLFQFVVQNLQPQLNAGLSIILQIQILAAEQCYLITQLTACEEVSNISMKWRQKGESYQAPYWYPTNKTMRRA